MKADGTGTIEQTNLANKEMLGMAAGMARQAVQKSGSRCQPQAPNLDNIGDLFDEAKIREQASSFGQGVRFVSSAPLSEQGLTGVKATFAFDDVRLLNLSNRQNGAPAAADAATALRARSRRGRRLDAARPLARRPPGQRRRAVHHAPPTARRARPAARGAGDGPQHVQGRAA